jgi:hypothetical protein
MLEPLTRRPYTHERPRTERLWGSCARQATRRQEKGAALVPLVREEGRRRGGGERRGGSARGCRDNVWSWRGTKSAHACAATARWLSRCGLCESHDPHILSLGLAPRRLTTRPCVVSTSVYVCVASGGATQKVWGVSHICRRSGNGQCDLGGVGGCTMPQCTIIRVTHDVTVRLRALLPLTFSTNYDRTSIYNCVN